MRSPASRPTWLGCWRSTKATETVSDRLARRGPGTGRSEHGSENCVAGAGLEPATPRFGGTGYLSFLRGSLGFLLSMITRSQTLSGFLLIPVIVRGLCGVQGVCTCSS